MSDRPSGAYRARHPPPDGTAAADWRPWIEGIHPFLAARFPAAGAAELIRARAELVDHALRAQWRRRGLDQQPGLALLAVGGYGRAELHPHSDIDILILRADRRRGAAALVPFVQALWDCGLKLAQSVRTPAQCRRDARGDIALMTSWLETRLLGGDRALADGLERALLRAPGPLRRPAWSRARFFRGKLAEQAARHRRFGGAVYRLEPNVKEGPGGLRDLQTIAWLLQWHTRAGGGPGFCADDEAAELAEARRFLWNVRFALHDISGQAEERLLFPHQYAVARRLGYEDRGPNRTIEPFMQDYYRRVGGSERLTEMLTQQYRELLAGPPERPPEPLNACFQVADGYLELRDPQAFDRHPAGLLELFLLLQRHPELRGVRAAAIRAVRAGLPRIDARFRAAPAHRALFMEILRQPRHVARELRRMHRYGVLAAYWPDFARLAGRMQYDLFHVYPVDEHILQVLTELRRITRADQDGEFALYHSLFLQFPKPELLYLAALFHDIGKGRGGDHSELGAAAAAAFCRQHGLSAHDTGLVRWLVRQHLLLSLTAQKRDISDPEVLDGFVAEVGNGMRLRGLYLLTVADLRGTNPALWTPWRRALLHRLYEAADRRLQEGGREPADAARLAADLQASALAKLDGLDAAACRRFWAALPPSDLLRYTDDELAWQTRAVLTRPAAGDACAFVRALGPHHCTEVLIHAERRAGLFAPVTAALARLGMDVLYARVTETRDGQMLQTFLVTTEDGQPVPEGPALEELRATLNRVARDPARFDRPVLRRARPRTRHFEIPTEVGFESRPARGMTRMTLSAADYPGLLWTVSDTLDRHGVLLHQARITTLGAQAQDAFLLTGGDGAPLDDAALQARIAEELRRRIAELREPARAA